MIYIASDHAGYKLKEKLKKSLGKKMNVVDLGPHKYDKNDDYPDYAFKLAKIVSSEKNQGVLICGTGQGMSTTANKVKGAYAVFVYDKKSAKQAKRHGNSNIITLGAKFTNEKKAREIINTWLKEKFQGGRHSRRLKKIQRIEGKR